MEKSMFQIKKVIHLNVADHALVINDILKKSQIFALSTTLHVLPLCWLISMQI